MKKEEEEAPKDPVKKRHRHIGPNVRAYIAGRALCPICDAERISSKVSQEKRR